MAPETEVRPASPDITHDPEIVRQLLDSAPWGAVVLDADRRILFSNAAVVRMAGAAEPGAVLGRRPGDALGCIHALSCATGCGGTDFCKSCGALDAINSGLRGLPDTKECRMTRLRDGNEEALDLLVSVVPVRDNLVCTLVDIGHEKRRSVLERTFLHDVLNLAGNVAGFASVLSGVARDPGVAEHARLLSTCANLLIGEIQAHRDLLEAEGGRLIVATGTVQIRPLITEIANLYRVQADGRILAVSSEDLELVTDSRLLGRVLGNMLKNALEASDPGDTIVIGCRAGRGEVEFWVHNPGVMPAEVQRQVFKRSFSTKGEGRGLGTYSIKLLTERYLGGRVGFRSDDGHGTTFFVHLPVAD